MSRSAQRLTGLLVLLVAGILSLPLSAALFDGEGSENWILPVALVVMAAIGAGLSFGLPALAGETATAGRRALVGAGWGVLASVVGVLVFWVLLNGFGRA